MSDQIQHIYLSPHLDDAVCSCGGLISQQTRRGEKALIVTLFSAGIEDASELPPYLRALHLLWGFASSDPFGIRREEDLAALEMVGAEHRHVGWRGALYRQNEDGRFLYTGLSYFGPAVRDDLRLLVRIRALLMELRQRHPEAIMYAPLGVGGHIDHRLTHQAARLVPGPMRFYEDVPYVFVGKVSPVILGFLTQTQRLGLRRDFSGGTRANGLVAAIQSKTSLFGGPQWTLFANRPRHTQQWQDILHPINRDDKFDAILAYASQIPMLCGSSHRAWQSLENYATSIAPPLARPVERQWVLSSREDRS